MSAGADHKTPSRLSHGGGVDALLKSGGAPSLMRRWRSIDFDHDVPFGSGYNVEGTIVYLDRDLVRAVYDPEYAKQIVGAAIDTGLDPHDTIGCLWKHEQVEKVLLDSDNPIESYEAAHEFASAAEHDMVREQGSTPLKYERGLKPLFAYCAKKPLKNVPKDFSAAAALDDPAMLAKLKAAGVEDADRVSKQSVNYGKGYGDELCSKCTMWQGQGNSPLAPCSHVEGLVRADRTCDKFQPSLQGATPSAGEAASMVGTHPRGEADPAGDTGSPAASPLNSDPENPIPRKPAPKPATEKNPPQTKIVANPDLVPESGASKPNIAQNGPKVAKPPVPTGSAQKKEILPASADRGRPTEENSPTGQNPPAFQPSGPEKSVQQPAGSAGSAERSGETRDIEIARHGATALNDEDTSVDRIRGHKDIPLSKEGIAEAHRLAKQISQDPPDVIVTSDLKRAADTAKIVADACGLPVSETMKGLRPWALGRVTGMLTKDAIPILARYIQHPDKRVPAGNGEPEGHSFNEFLHTYLNTILDVLEKYEGRVLFVAHHRNERAMFAWKAAGFPPDGSVDIQVFNKKGEAPGTVCPMQIPVEALERFERRSQKGNGNGESQKGNPQANEEGNSANLKDRPGRDIR